MQTHKFRSFSSKDQEGFIIFSDGKIPAVIFEDILFQLFEPSFPDIMCPEVYYFSSTDDMLTYNKMLQAEDYIYVHFLERVDLPKIKNNLENKLILCPFEELEKGVHFDGVNLYIIGEKSYLMYRKEYYRQTIRNKIQQIKIKKGRKIDRYRQYIEELSMLKQNFQILELKQELEITVNDFKERLQKLQEMEARLLKAKSTLSMIMKNSGINLKSVYDLY